MKKLMLVMLVGVFLISVVSADLIEPGTRSIEITNKIINMNDFPDYVFVESGHESIGYQMCPPRLIGEEGIILGGYKFCDISVYAVKKDKINVSDFRGPFFHNFDDDEFEKYWESLDAKEVIRNVNPYGMVSIISTGKSIKNEYIIDLSKVKTEPDNKEEERDYSKYLYLLIPLISLIIMIVLIRKYKKNEFN